MKKILVLLLVALAALALLSGCVDSSTELRLASKDGDFSGSRLITLSVDTALIEDNLEYGVEDLDRYIEEHLPKEFSGFERSESYNPTEYIFTLSFESLEDYEQKVESLTGRDVNISCAYSDKSIFSQYFTLSEDFTSIELFDWVKTALEESGAVKAYAQANNVSESDLEGKYDSAVSEGESVIVVGQNSYKAAPGALSYEAGNGDIVRLIEIDTKINDDGSFTRRVRFTLEPLDNEKLDSVFEYFNSHVPADARTEQSSSSSSTVYLVSFDSSNTAELYTETSTVFGGLCPVYSSEHENPDSPLSTLTYFDSSIDFGLFGSNGINYVYTLSSASGLPVEAADADSGETYDYSIEGSSISFSGTALELSARVVLESLDATQGIDYNLIMLSQNEFVREIKIYMDAKSGTDSLNQMAEYFKAKNAPSTSVDVKIPDNAPPYISITIKGSADELILVENTLFGEFESRQLSYSRDNDGLFKKLFKIKPDTLLIDSFDISALLSITNTDSFIYTFVSPETIHTAGSADGVSTSDLSTKVISQQMVGGIHSMSFAGNYVNILAVVFLCLLIVLIILLVALFIAIFKRRKDEDEEEKQAAITDGGERALPEPEQQPVPIEPEPAPIFEIEPELMPMPEPIEVGSYDDSTIPVQEHDDDILGIFPELDFFEPDTESEAEPIPEPTPEPELEPIPMPEPPIQSERTVPVYEPDPFFDDYEDRFPLEKLPEFVQSRYGEEPGQQEQYSNRDFISDLKYLGYLDDYKNRSPHKVKVKVKRRNNDDKHSK